MMRVRVYSWFNSRNIGDILIAKCVSESFSHFYGCEYYDIVTGHKVERPILLFPETKQNRQIKDRILNQYVLRNAIDFIYALRKCQISSFLNIKKDCDIAIFAGGNLLMDLEPFLPNESIVTYRRIKELKKQGIVIIYCFSGVGPYKNPISKILARKILRNIDFISVRDNASYEFCKHMGRMDRLEIWRDPVLMYRPSVREMVKDTIAVNVYFGANHALTARTRDSYINMIKCIRASYPDMRIKLFATDTGDMVDVNCVYESVCQDVSVSIAEINNEDALFALYAKSTVLVGMRMHSLITAVISGVPVVAISWQNKVSALMEYLNIEDQLISQDSFCDDFHTVLPIVERTLANKKAVKNAEKIIGAERVRFREQFTTFCERWRDQ